MYNLLRNFHAPMKRAGTRLAGAFFLLCVSLFAQPDCSFNFSLSGSGAELDSDAYPNKCPYLWIEYKSTGFSAVTVTLQGAPDSSGSPGAWGTLDGTVTVGSNPLTSTTGAYAAITANTTDLAAWLRVDISGTTGTGTVSGQVYGYLSLLGLGDEEEAFVKHRLHFRDSELFAGYDLIAVLDRRRYA